LTLTFRDILTDLRISEQAGYKLLQSGRLKSFKIGNRYRVTEEALREFKENAQVIKSCDGPKL